MSAIADYLSDIHKQPASGGATENTYRLAFRGFLQASGKNINTTNELKHIPLWVNANQLFDVVPKNVWECRIGSYQPCQK